MTKKSTYIGSGSGTLIEQFEKDWEVFILCFCCHAIKDLGQQTFIWDFWSKEFRAKVFILSFSISSESLLDLDLNIDFNFAVPCSGTFSFFLRSDKKSSVSIVKLLIFCILISINCMNNKRKRGNILLKAIIFNADFLKCTTPTHNTPLP